jgi:hypothetical protein
MSLHEGGNTAAEETRQLDRETLQIVQEHLGIIATIEALTADADNIEQMSDLEKAQLEGKYEQKTEDYKIFRDLLDDLLKSPGAQ